MILASVLTRTDGASFFSNNNDEIYRHLQKRISMKEKRELEVCFPPLFSDLGGGGG